MVTLYSKPNCVQCDMTKKVMDKEGIEVNVIDVSTDAEAYKHVTETLGYQAAPVVQWENAEGTLGGHWAGFKSEKIRELAGVLG